MDLTDFIKTPNTALEEILVQKLEWVVCEYQKLKLEEENSANEIVNK